MDSLGEDEKSISNPDVENCMAKEDTFIVGDTRPREDSSSKELKHKKAQALAKANARHIIKSWKTRHLNMDTDYLRADPSRSYVQHAVEAVQTTSGEKIYFKWGENGKIMNPRQPKAVSKLYAYKRKRMSKKKANFGVLASKSAPSRDVEYSTNVKNDRINTSTAATNLSLAERNENKIADRKAYTGREEKYSPESQTHQIHKVKRVEFDLSADIHLGVKEAFLSGSARTKGGNSSVNKKNNATRSIHPKSECHKKEPLDSNTSIFSSDGLADSDKENVHIFAPSNGPVICLSNNDENGTKSTGYPFQRPPKEQRRRGPTNGPYGGNISLPHKQTSFAKKKELAIEKTGKKGHIYSKPHPPFPKSNLHTKSSDSLSPVQNMNGDKSRIEANNGYTLKTTPNSNKEISLSEKISFSTNKRSNKLHEEAVCASEDKVTVKYKDQSIKVYDYSFRNVSQLDKTQTSAAPAQAVAMRKVKENGDVLEKLTSKERLHGYTSSSSHVVIGKDTNKHVTSATSATNSLLIDPNITLNQKEKGELVENRGHLRTIVEGCAESIEQSANDSSQSCASVLTDSMASNEALNDSNGPALYQVQDGLLSNTFPKKNKPGSFMKAEVLENRLSVSWPKTRMPRTNTGHEMVKDSVGKSTTPNRLDLFGVEQFSGDDSLPLSINRYKGKSNTDDSKSHAFDSVGKSAMFSENESIIGTSGYADDKYRKMKSDNQGEIWSVHLNDPPKNCPVSLDISSASQYPDSSGQRLLSDETGKERHTHKESSDILHRSQIQTSNPTIGANYQQMNGNNFPSASGGTEIDVVVKRDLDDKTFTLKSPDRHNGYTDHICPAKTSVTDSGNFQKILDTQNFTSDETKLNPLQNVPDVVDDRKLLNQDINKEIQGTDQDLWPASGRPLSACPSRQLGLPLLWTDEGDGAQDDDLKFINDENDFYEVFGYDAETTELLRATRIFPVNDFESEQEKSNSNCISGPGKGVAQSNSDISGERPRVSGHNVCRDIKSKRNLGDIPLNVPERGKNTSLRDDLMLFQYSNNVSDPEDKKVEARKRTESFASRTQSDESLYGNVHLLSKDGMRHHTKCTQQNVMTIISTSSSSSPSSSYASQMTSPPIFSNRKGESQGIEPKGQSEINPNNIISMAKGKNVQTWRKISQGDDIEVERHLPKNKMNLGRAPRPPPPWQASPGDRKTARKVTESQQTVTSFPLQQRKMHNDSDVDLKNGVTLNYFPEPVTSDCRSVMALPQKTVKPLLSRKIRQPEICPNPSLNHSLQKVHGPEHKQHIFTGPGHKLKRQQDDDHILTSANANLAPGLYNEAADRIRHRILEQNPGPIIRDNSLHNKNGRKPPQLPNACSNTTETKGQSNVKHSVRDKDQNTHSPLSTELSDHSSLIKPRKLKPIIHHPGMHKRHQHLASGL